VPDKLQTKIAEESKAAEAKPRRAAESDLDQIVTADITE
jgi:hypothetical protein